MSSEKILTDRMPNKHIDENGVQWTYSACHFCHMNCGIIVGVKEGKIVEIRPNEERWTVLCQRMGEKGERAIKFHYHPKRVNHPLKRVGKRGEDKWVQISYEQAMDEIAAKLKTLKEKYGPETLAVSEGTYRSDHLWARTRFTNLFGNPGNIIDPGTICWCWTYTINMAMVGWPVEISMPPTGAAANTMVFWGVRPDERYAPESAVWRTIMEGVNREGKKPSLIVVDPVCIEPVKYATNWLAIRPGTDLIMVLAWINYIISNELYDKDFLKNWTNGPFLIRKDNHLLVRGSDVDKNGKEEDFVVWNDKTGRIAVWCSDKNCYYDSDVDAPYKGEFEVTFANGSKVQCMTAFDAISERMKEYTVERAAEVTGVPEPTIIQAVHTYATNRPGFIAWGIGGGDMHGYNATYMALGKTLLRCLTGNIDVYGGEFLADPGPVGDDGVKTFPVRDAELELSEKVSPEARAKYLGNDQFRIMSWKGFEKIDKCYRKMWNIPRPMLHQLLVTPPLLWKAILEEDPYPVKAVICWSSNPLAWAPNVKRVYEALKALDLLVVVDYWKTPTAAIADYIIPAADSLERPLATTVEDSFDSIQGGDRGVQPEGERRMDYDFFRELGIRLGQEEYWPWKTYEELIAYRIERAGWNYKDFVEEGIIQAEGGMQFEKHKNIIPNGQVKGFATPSRKAEIFPSVIQELGYDPIPFYRELPETPLSNPELAKEYPLRLTVSGRWNPQYHSEHRVPGTGTRSMYPWPTVKIHMYDARRLGIRQGDWVWIETPRGRIRQVADLGWDIVEGVVQAQPSWWYPELPAEEPWSQGIFESNGNVLVDDSIESLDPGTGTWIARGLLCKVYPCIDGADRSCENISVEDFKKGDTYYHKQYANLEHNLHDKKK